MMTGNIHIEQILNHSVIKIRAFLELMKLRLSLLVAFSSGIGYMLAVGNIDWFNFMLFFLGGILISSSAVTINQILEKDLDKLMKRTMDRPLPSGKISVQEASIFAILTMITGAGLLFYFTNPLTVILSLISLIIYGFIYTPLKKVGPVAVFVGAIPGALPPLLGWVAATGGIQYEALILFGIQFIWQFPHFWAIAWIADEDYKNAGFKLLPSGGGKDLNTAFQIMIYTLFLLPLGLLPAKFGITGINSAFIATVCGVLFLSQTFLLMKNGSRKSALKIMYGSFLYLPIVQIAFVLDKI